MKSNILQLVTGLGVGGAERVVLDLSIGLDKSKYNNYVLSLSKKNEMLDIFKENNIDVTSLNKNNSLKDFISMIFETKNFVKTHKINLIHAHMTHAMILAVIVKIFFPKLKIVFTSHNTTFGSKIRNILIYILKPFRNIDILFSEEQRTSIYKNQYKVIPNGINTKPYQIKLNKFEKFTFLSVGRLDEAKNHLHLIDCAKDLADKNLDFEVLIAGEGSLRNQIEEKISKYNLQKKVKLLGIRRDIKELMSQSHVFVMPSLWEGLPIVLLEAGASDLPCISTPVGTITSLLNESNAYLSDNKNFSNTMEYVYNNYKEAIEKSKKLHEKVLNNYSIESIVINHELIYDQYLK
jgi:glycosyltransferase involved in cell wall biosynthesis